MDAISRIQEILDKHALWLNGDSNGKQASFRKAELKHVDLQNANLQKIDFRYANLQESNLKCANLKETNLFSANLQSANLYNADIQNADLQWANLQLSNMRNANLQSANLYRANLSCTDLRNTNLLGTNLHGTVLDTESVWDWVQKERCLIRTVNNRSLCLGSILDRQKYAGEPEYIENRVYKARWFSACPVTICHQGLYVMGGPEKADVLVAFWLDEAVVVGSKCRVPRLLIINSVDAFNQLDQGCLDINNAIVLPNDKELESQI